MFLDIYCLFIVLYLVHILDRRQSKFTSLPPSQKASFLALTVNIKLPISGRMCMRFLLKENVETG